VLSPDSGKGTETTGGLDVANKTDSDHLDTLLALFIPILSPADHRVSDKSLMLSLRVILCVPEESR
jgi:hypothetical protein